MSPLLLLALATAAAPPPAKPAPLSGRELYTHAARGTVSIQIGSTGIATGWVYDAQRRLIVTNYHVAADGHVLVYYPIFENGRLVSDPKRYARKGVRARVIDSDPKIDLAVLEAESLPPGAHALSLAHEAALPGDKLHLVGNPGVSSGLFVYTTGTLRQTTRQKFTFRRGGQSIDMLALETQMASNGGDSGSAILNDVGQVVGVNFAGFDGGKVDGNGEFRLVNTYALAVSLEELRAFLADVNELSTSKARAGAYERRAARLDRKGKYALAFADVSRSIELDPTQASAFTLRATLNHKRRHHDAVIRDASKALDLDPRDFEAANLRGIAHAARRDFKRAGRDYALAIRQQPLNATYRLNRAVAHAEAGNPRGALADLDEAIRLVPTYVPAYRERGIVHRSKGDYAKAIADFEAGVRLTPNDVVLMHWLADTRLTKGDFKAATEAFDRGLKLAPREAILWRGLGDARFALKNYDLAIEAYTQAAKHNPKDAIALYRRGRSLEQQGDVDEAQDDFVKAIALQPSLESELKTFNGRLVRVTNHTAEPLKVYVSFEDATRGTSSGWVTFAVEAGSTLTLHHEGKPIEARKLRIWAEGGKSGKKFDALKRRDVVLAERTYRARQIDAHVHRFGE